MTRNAPTEQWYREGYTVGERAIVLATGFSGVIELHASKHYADETNPPGVHIQIGAL